MRYVRTFLSRVNAHKRTLLKLSALSVLAGFVFIVLLFAYFSKDLPSSGNIGSLYVVESTKLYDRTGETVLYDIYGEEKRTVAAHDEIADSLRFATIAAEDTNFYNHYGIDPVGIVRAALRNIRGGGISEGGSTITQQFIKGALLTPERTWTRKAKEAILAIELEWRYDKDEILDLYLNQIPYGSNAYGAEAASQLYFGKNAKDLTHAEAAVLAAVPRAPTFYSPYGNNTDRLKQRQEHILGRMRDLGYISQEDYGIAKSEDVTPEPYRQNINAPHFVMYVREYLERKYGAEYVQSAGLKVTTSLDTDLQRAAEGVVAEYGPLNQTRYGARNASLVSVDPHTGHILAMVGSRDYFDVENDGNVNVTIRPRQPGSSFKPFAYAKALEKGYTADSMIYDVPTEFNPTCSWEATGTRGTNGLACYNPQNYDGSHRGPISFKEALAQSLNIPAVKVLYLAGIPDTINLAKQMGVNSLVGREDDFGLALVLGGAEVTLLEETSAFGTFATRGETNAPVGVLRVEDNKGNVLEEFRKNPRDVLDEGIADQINYMLGTNALRAPLFGVNNSLNIPGLPSAAKTGTTQFNNNAWTVGYTRSISAGVWVGNNDNSAMRGATGAGAAAPIWKAFMQKAYEVKATAQTDADNASSSSEYAFSLPTRSAEQPFVQPSIPRRGKTMLDGALGERPHSLLFYVNRDNPLGSAPGYGSDDPLFKNWEPAVRAFSGLDPFATDRQLEEQEQHDEEENGDIDTSTPGSIDITFIAPQKHSFSRSETLPVEVSLTSSYNLASVSARLDGQSFYQQDISSASQTKQFSFSTSRSLSGLPPKNFHELTVEVEDVRGNVRTKSFVFTVD
ncbi:MAG: PBP1A family penicillin-binding protein [Candidatus Spechtbacterales bacterium]